jgi:hypothetical protein
VRLGRGRRFCWGLGQKGQALRYAPSTRGMTVKAPSVSPEITCRLAAVIDSPPPCEALATFQM